MRQCKGICKNKKRCNNKINKNYCHSHINQAQKCMICLQYISHNVIELTCSHFFHLDCIFELMKHIDKNQFKCPVCRQTYKNYINEQRKLWFQTENDLRKLIIDISCERTALVLTVCDLTIEKDMLIDRLSALQKMIEIRSNMTEI